MQFDLGTQHCCTMGEIGGFKEGKVTDAAIKKIIREVYGIPNVNDVDMIYYDDFDRASSDIPHTVIFADIVGHTKHYQDGKPGPVESGAAKLAEFIEKNKLGTIYSTRPRQSGNHPENIIKSWMWQPPRRLNAEQKALIEFDTYLEKFKAAKEKAKEAERKRREEWDKRYGARSGYYGRSY